MGSQDKKKREDVDDNGFTERLEHYEYLQSELQDHWIIYTAGVALGVALSFVRELNSPLDHAWTIVVSWGLLALSVSAAVSSIATGRVSVRKVIAYRRQNPGHPQPDDIAKLWVQITGVLNCTALVSLVGGLAAMVAFGALNFG